MGRLTTDYKEYLYERLQEPDAVIGYLNAALEGGDPGTFLLALRYVAEARGIANVAAGADLNRESLYKMLSDQGNPRLSSVLALFGAIGVQLSVGPLRKDAIAQKAPRDQVRPMLAVVGSEKTYVSQLEDEYESTHTREPEPAAA